MDGDGVSQIQLRELITAIENPALIRGKCDLAGLVFVVDGADNTDIAVEDSEIIIVAGVDHPIVPAQNPRTKPNLRKTYPRRIDLFLENCVKVASAQRAPGHWG